MIYEELYVGFGNPLTTSLLFLTNTDTIATPIYMNHIEGGENALNYFKYFTPIKIMIYPIGWTNDCEVLSNCLSYFFVFYILISLPSAYLFLRIGY